MVTRTDAEERVLIALKIKHATINHGHAKRYAPLPVSQENVVQMDAVAPAVSVRVALLVAMKAFVLKAKFCQEILITMVKCRFLIIHSLFRIICISPSMEVFVIDPISTMTTRLLLVITPYSYPTTFRILANRDSLHCPYLVVHL